jgi:hypothetical protein
LPPVPAARPPPLPHDVTLVGSPVARTTTWPRHWAATTLSQAAACPHQPPSPTPACPCRPFSPCSCPPLPGANTATGHPYHLGIAAVRHHRPGTRASHHPRCSSGGHRPHCRAILLGCQRRVHLPHYPHITGVVLKAREEAATPTALSSIKVQEISTYIFPTRYGLWIVVECI